MSEKKTCGHNCHLLRTGLQCSPCRFKETQNDTKMTIQDLKIFQFEVQKLMKKYDVNDFILIADDENDCGLIQMCETKESKVIFDLNNSLTDLFETFSQSSTNHS